MTLVSKAIGRVTRIAATGTGTRFFYAGRARRVAMLARRVAMLSSDDRETLARAAVLIDALARD